MTDTEIRLALALAHGFEWYNNGQGRRCLGRSCDDHFGPDDTSPLCDDALDLVPDYLSGVEALGHLHEIEEKMTDAQCRIYARFLRNAIGPVGYDEWSDLYDFRLAHADARTRAIALIKTLRTWKGESS